MILYSNLRQLYSLLDVSRKARIKLVIFLMIVTTILEMSSVGLVVPAIGWLLKGDGLSATSASGANQQVLNNEGVYFGLILLLFAFTVKGIFLIKVREVLVFRVLSNIVLITEKGANTSKL